ncbi:hypothetical protein OSB04_020130 [Centaurea solstitialis]|uniref:Uncharacterized protein n=1 Tax=Centaurea solstitialis TaxID=347529 RepID=A0AA38TA30_9ASTR|nr:hypothetical protein OSB04_020130 [Centaurea solstitialis]
MRSFLLLTATFPNGQDGSSCVSTLGLTILASAVLNLPWSSIKGHGRQHETCDLSRFHVLLIIFGYCLRACSIIEYRKVLIDKITFELKFKNNGSDTTVSHLTPLSPKTQACFPLLFSDDAAKVRSLSGRRRLRPCNRRQGRYDEFTRSKDRTTGSLAPKIGSLGLSPKIREDIAKETAKDRKGLRVTVNHIVQNRQAKVSVVPSAVALVIESNYESNGSFGIEIGAITKKLWPKQNRTKIAQMLAIASHHPSDR